MAKGTKRGTISRRAPILLRALDCINSSDYDDQGEYIIFGKELDEILDEAGLLSHEVQDSPDREPLRKLVSDIRTHRGRERAARRTSLGKPPALKNVRGLDELSPEALSALEKRAKEARTGGAEDDVESRVIDDLDAFYAHKVLAELPKIVGRASVLETVDLPEVPDNVRKYFEEAHRCFLYGFPIACAVLCRAILESALKQTIDPRGVIEANLAKGHSYFKALINKAEKLKDDRQCALDVKDAGDWAIHDLKRFDQRYGGERLGEVIPNTRKVLTVLYAKKA